MAIVYHESNSLLWHMIKANTVPMLSELRPVGYIWTLKR